MLDDLRPFARPSPESIPDLLSRCRSLGRPLHVCAPMVRYSKLPFRRLCRLYDIDLCYTPMTIASCFVQSEKARAADFSTGAGDTPLIVQFAAQDTHTFVQAAQLVQDCSEGVDLNCGCPQRWAMCEGYGCTLLKQPELIRDMVLQTRNALTVGDDFIVSIKIRVEEDLSKTIRLIENAYSAGIGLCAIHARTPAERHQPIRVEALKELRSSLPSHLPLIANGDVASLEQCERLAELTGMEGMMSARGLLANPCLFAGVDQTPPEAVEQYLLFVAEDPTVNYITKLHQLAFMLEEQMSKPERVVFNALRGEEPLLEYLQEHGWVSGAVAQTLREMTVANETCCYSRQTT